MSAAEGGRLVRSLGALDLTLIGIGASIGSGIFVLSGVALQTAGPGVAFSFIIAAAVCALDALCYAELASRFPSSGGAYLFARHAFGNPVALCVAINLLFDYHIGAAAIARSFCGYLRNLTGAPSWVAAIPVSGIISLNVVAPLLIAALTAVLLRGAGSGATLNRLLTGLKLATILLVICAGASRADTALLSPLFPKGATPVLAQSATLFFAYVGTPRGARTRSPTCHGPAHSAVRRWPGFDAVANGVEECRSPARDMPRAICASLGTCAALYVGVVLVLAGLVQYDQLDESAPLAAAFERQGGMRWGATRADRTRDLSEQPCSPCSHRR